MGIVLLSEEQITDIINRTALAVVADLRNDLRKDSDWVDKAGLAEHFKCSPATVNRWINQGCPVERISEKGHPRFRKTLVEGWLGERKEDVSRQASAAKG